MKTPKRSTSGILRAAHEELALEKELAEAVFDATADTLIVFDPNSGQAVRWNRAFRDVSGYSDAEIKQLRAPDSYYDKEDLRNARGTTRLLFERGWTSAEVTLITKDGRRIPFEHRAGLIRDEAGEPRYVVSFGRDISERRATDARLRYHAGLIDSVSDAIISTGEGLLIQSWSPAAEQIYGWSAAEALGRVFNELMEPKYPGTTREIVLRVFGESGHWQGEVLHRCKNGSRVRIWSNVTALKNDDGSATGMVAVNKDITEVRLLEERLHQAQKMEAVGQLAGGVAHDFNNLLTVVSSFSQVMLEELDPDAPFRDEVEEIRAAAERAAKITKQLLAFSSRQILEPRTFDPNVVVANMTGMLQRLLGESIQLSLRPDPQGGLIHADPGQLEQVIVNLAVNARDAMLSGGRLAVSLETRELDADQLDRHPDAAPGPHVVIVVADTGVGMDGETRAHIFEPFFTTKATGKGTGLGLATVYGIVRQSGGHIDVDSAAGVGTTFCISFPRSAQGVESGPRASQVVIKAPVRGSETVLLVEDDRAVRKVTRIVLQKQGYEVLTAASAAEALKLSREHSGPIQLLLTDVVMPEGNGPELAALLVQSRPDTKVLYASGYTDADIVHHGVLDEGVQFIGKPFKPSELAQKVREVLDD